LENKIYEFFKELKFNDGEIENLLEIAPAIAETSVNDIVENMSVVVRFGFPADDIGSLIALNPAFLCRNNEDLIIDLIELSKTTDDIEEALKNNPYLI